MKRTSSVKVQPPMDDLRPEYRFDYSRAKPNRFAAQFEAGAVAVVLDPDVAAVFRTSEAVNALLRSVISALPPLEPAAVAPVKARVPRAG
ncbi:MAG TPA: hypothetical protein VF017_01310 [Thermoanaerobaculia bacterium]|nr:hypothetical protein [Thermoanaerobaculia bacterium]